MITISITTIIAGAVVVLLAILGSLVNPFLRSLRFPETEGNETEGNVTEGNEAEFSQKENAEPVTILITAHDNLSELERNLPMFLNQQYAAVRHIEHTLHLSSEVAMARSVYNVDFDAFISY